MAPQAVNLEPHREWIVSQIKAGATLEYIACHLPLDCPPVSAKLLSRRLDAWGVRNEATGRQGVRPRKRRDAGLEAARPWIVGLYQQMDKIATIRGKIKERTGIEVSKQRLHALLHDDWNVPPRRERAAAPDVQDFITKQAGLGAPVSKIQGGLQDELQLRVTTRWIYLKMHEWGIELPGHQLESMPAPVLTSIKQYIEVTFYESRHTDANMKQQLEAKGYSISLLKIFKLRMEMGLRRRHDAAQVEECLDRLRNAMWSSPRAGVLFPRLTKKMLPIFCRQTFHIPVSRGMAWKFLQEEYPEEMLTRVRTIARKRGGFLCPGPNYIWSIDAYCKLAHWGIEVYACIDAYSRYIVWGHVGHTAQTQRSVCLQYTDTVRTLGYLPLIMRSDHGVETGMIAGAHYWLSAASKEPRLLKPTRNDRGQVVWIYREVVDGEEVRHEVPADPEQGVAYPKFGPERNLEFKDCYSYGLSTKNQRIESWWSELNFHVTLFWRVSRDPFVSFPLRPVSRPPPGRAGRRQHAAKQVQTRASEAAREGTGSATFPHDGSHPSTCHC